MDSRLSDPAAMGLNRYRLQGGRVATAVLLAVGILAGLIACSYHFTSEQVPPSSAWRSGLGVEIFQGAQFRPERKESRAFLLFCGALPVVSILSLKLAELAGKSKHGRWCSVAAAVLNGAGLLYLWIASAFDRGLIWATLSPFVVPGTVLSAGVCLLILATRRLRGRLAYSVAAECLGLAACVALAFYEMSPGWMSVYATTHLEPILFPVIQVMDGRTILVDAQSVYGLYPHFLEPIFRLLPLSVSTFSFVMAVLLFVTLFAVYRFLRLSTPGPLTATIAFLGYLFGPFTALNAGYPHYQCYPLRTVFPALVLWLGARYLKQASPLRLAALAFTCGLSVLWNLDSGIACLGGAVALLLISGRNHNSWKELFLTALRKAGLFTLVAAGTVLSFCTYLYVRSGEMPRHGELFTFQSLFYQDGFLMEPMRLLGGWWLIIIAYVWAMISAMTAFCRGGSKRLSPCYAMLAVMGLGLFAYYQGRSVVPNLYYVAWPAYLVCGLFLGDLTRQSRRWLLRLRDPWQWADQAIQASQFATLVFSICLLVASMIHCGNRVGMFVAWSDYQATYQVYEQDWHDRVRPVEQTLGATGDKRPVLVLSARDHLWHLFLKHPSALNNAGFNHMFREEEFGKVCRMIEEQGVGCVVWDETYLQTPMPEIEYGYVSQTEKVRLLQSLRKGYRVSAIHAGKGDLPFSVWVPATEPVIAAKQPEPQTPGAVGEAALLSRNREAAEEDFAGRFLPTGIE